LFAFEPFVSGLAADAVGAAQGADIIPFGLLDKFGSLRHERHFLPGYDGIPLMPRFYRLLPMSPNRRYLSLRCKQFPRIGKLLQSNCYLNDFGCKMIRIDGTNVESP